MSQSETPEVDMGVAMAKDFLSRSEVVSAELARFLETRLRAAEDTLRYERDRNLEKVQEARRAQEETASSLAAAIEHIDRDTKELERLHAERDALESRVKVLEEALQKYGYHIDRCDGMTGGECDCGFRAALERSES